MSDRKITKRMQKRLGKGWREIVEEQKKRYVTRDPRSRRTHACGEGEE